MIQAAEKLGILAGGGDAPKRLIALLEAENRPFFVVCLNGQADAGLADGHDHVWLPLGAGGAAVEAMRAAGVRDLVMIGRVRRPSWLELKPDLFAARKLAQAGFALLGDDGLLRAVAKIMEGEGFRLVGLQDVFADFLTPPGQLGGVAPSEQDRQDIRRAVAVARKLGEADAGQAVVVQQGIVLGIEAAEGTDAMIARAGMLKREGGGGVLVKLCKPGQDRRLDLPAIGAETVAHIAAAGLAGIAAEAGASLLIGRAETAAAADKAGIFLYGWRGEMP